MRFIHPDFEWEQKTTRGERREMARRQQAAMDAERQYVEGLRPLLSPPLQVLLDLDVSDGLTRLFVYDVPRRELRIYLRCGNLQVGYFDLNLRYKEIALTRRDVLTLRLVARQDRYQGDVQGGEVDIAEGETPRFVHRLQWNSGLVVRRETAQGIVPPRRKPFYRRPAAYHVLEPEIELRFDALELEMVPTTGRDFPMRGRRFLLLR